MAAVIVVVVVTVVGVVVAVVAVVARIVAVVLVVVGGGSGTSVLVRIWVLLLALRSKLEKSRCDCAVALRAWSKTPKPKSL